MQKNMFLEGEGDKYFKRNAAHLLQLHSDPSQDTLLKILQPLKPATILEVGCANGWRLDVAAQRWNARCTGIDPSQAAIEDGRSRFPSLNLLVGTADKIPNDRFDCIVFGFCLYLCDRTDLFHIAARADQALNAGGYLLVYDFCPPTTYRNPYSHAQGLHSYKMDHSRLWSWHPAYALWSHEVLAHAGKSPEDPDERLAVTVLRKS